MAFRGDLEALVLGALQSGPSHGYEIGKRINIQCEDVIHIKEGQLYPILHRLENEGRILSEWLAVESGKPARRVYALTESGWRELENRRAAWQEFACSVNHILSAPPRLEEQYG